MTDKELEVQKQELTEAEDTERTRDCRCFSPRADIYEVDDQVVIVTDVPGVDENSVDISLEKNILTINAYIEPEELEIIKSQPWKGSSAIFASDGLFSFGAHIK